MIKDINAIIINTIVKSIPPPLKPVDYLMDVLDIGKESAYRRLRGKMSFSIEELIALSHDLGFSIDELVGLRDDSSRVAVDLKSGQDPTEAFITNLKNYQKDVEARVKSEGSSTILALNYLPTVFSVYYKDLFKFSYYSWLHHKNSGLSKLRYSDVELSPELERLRSSLDINTRKVKSTTFILDPNVFLAPLNKVRYFYKLKLINDDELSIIKTDFHRIVDFAEKLVRTGGSDAAPGTKYYFYLSDVNVDVNSSYSIWNNTPVSSFNFYFFNRIVIHNPEMCEAHREWLESLKKYSTLITQSNEIAQAEYFEQQRKYIEEVGK